MKLQDYPVPENNNKFGYHLFPFPQDLDGRDKAAHLWPLKETIRQGGQWVCMLSSPGGDTGWIPGQPGSCEWSFALSNELELWNMLRIYGSSGPPYWHPAIEKNLEQLVSIASGRPFYVKFNNEIDAEWGADHNGRTMTYEDAKACCIGIGYAIDRTWDKFNGSVIPSFLSVGYGGQGFNFFEIMHEIGMGDRLDRCWIPVHPYAGGWESMWPWSPTLLEPILYTPETYAQHSRWQWKLDAPDKRTLEMVNAELVKSHNERITLETTDDLLNAYAYGFFTYKWALYQLDELGHTETPLLFPEWGTRVGEDVVVGPKIDIDLHAKRTLEQIKLMQEEPRILGGANWLLDTRGGVQTNWKDQGTYCEIWDKDVVEIPNDLEYQIITPGRLRLVDELLTNPVKGVTMNKLCPHVQYLDNETLAAISRIKPPMVKIMNTDNGQLEAIRAASPDSLIVARVYQENQDYLTNPVLAGREFAERYSNIVNKIDVAEVLNEAINNLATPEQVEAFDIYQHSFAYRLWSMNTGVKVGLFCLPTGNFGWPGEPALTPEFFPKTFTLPVNQVYICVHEYTWYDWDYESGARLLRYRTQMDWAREQGYKLLITECGFTQAILENHPDEGWRSDSQVWTRGLYIDNLRQYEAQLQEDDYVVGAAIFTIGNNSGWDTFESLSEWEEMVSLPESVEPSPEPNEPPEEEPMPEPMLDWRIPDWNDAENLEVLAEPGELVWKLIQAELAPDNMANTVWIHVLDEQGQATQAPVIVQNVNGDEFTLPHKPGEPYNQPMFKNDVLTVSIGDSEMSDIVSNIHGAYWDVTGVNAFHVGYILTFQKWTVPAEDEEPEPPEPPTEITDDVIRETCWNNIYPVGGIRYNPEAALQAIARERGYGAPTTQEIDIWNLRAQGFVLKILFAAIGNWQAAIEVDW